MKKITYLFSLLMLFLPLVNHAQQTSFEQEEIAAAKKSEQYFGIQETTFPPLVERPSVMATIVPTAGATENFNVVNGDFFYDPSDGTNGGPGGVCTGTSSGDPGDYPNCNCTTVTTLTAANLSVTFLSYNIFGNFDYLNIYDGPDTNSPKIYDSNTNNTTDTYAGMVALVGNPPVFTASSGSLTFEFMATAVVNSCGWEAEINIVSTCATPTNAALVGVTDNSADFSWNASPDETDGYNWVVMADGENPLADTPVTGGSVVSGTITAQATGLMANMAYDFYIQTNCGSGDLSGWSSVLDFMTTMPPCDEPTAITLDNATGTSIEISWTASTTETDGYDWILMVQGEDPLVDPPLDAGTTATGVTMVDISGLSNTSCYDFYVSANCASGTMSDWEMLNVCTVGVATEDFRGYEYYPNPVRSDLVMKANHTISQIVVYNLLGQQVMKASPNRMEAILDFSTLQAGAYMVQVKVNDAIKTIRIIKE